MKTQVDEGDGGWEGRALAPALAFAGALPGAFRGRRPDREGDGATIPSIGSARQGA